MGNVTFNLDNYISFSSIIPVAPKTEWLVTPNRLPSLNYASEMRIMYKVIWAISSCIFVVTYASSMI
jgi:hypothetical protein